MAAALLQLRSGACPIVIATASPVNPARGWHVITGAYIEGEWASWDAPKPLSLNRVLMVSDSKHKHGIVVGLSTFGWSPLNPSSLVFVMLPQSYLCLYPRYIISSHDVYRLCKCLCRASIYFHTLTWTSCDLPPGALTIAFPIMPSPSAGSTRCTLHRHPLS
ncbi:hypothetical protein LXA43DRAFT_89875 [Ganoderma leucocontextum]|nr:hypothetical protein LXA43DRAFT_89875 [Ganoderma leucocontextum]